MTACSTPLVALIEHFHLFSGKARLRIGLRLGEFRAGQAVFPQTDFGMAPLEYLLA